MKTSDKLRLALRMFRTRPMRTGLTVLGVSVGIATVFFLVSFGYGLQETILNRIANADTLLTLDVTAGSDAVHLTQETIDDMKAITHVQEIARMMNISAQVSVGSVTSDMPIVAVDPLFFRYSGITAASGKLFNEKDQFAVVTSAGIQLFGANPDETLGKNAQFTLYIPQENADGKTQVREQTGSTLISGVVEDEDRSQLYMPYDFQKIPLDHIDQLKVKVDSQQNIEAVRNEILGQGFIVSSISDTIDQATKIFAVIQIVLGFFGLVALVVSAIGMFNTMTITLLERTSEIGIMRSIGITSKDIRSMFLVESMVMGFLGGMGGLFLGTVVGQTINFLINMLAHRFGGPSVNLFSTPFWFIMVIIIFSTFIGFVTGVYPSIRASKLNPLDALRYK